MTIIPATSELVLEASAVKLARYAAIIGYRETAFFGVNHPANVDFACREIWLKPQRDMVAKYLAEAQEEIESVVGYPLSPKYFVAEVYPYRFPLVARQGKIISAGVKATTTISLGAAVDHTADPATVGPILTTVTDASEVRVYHPGSSVEIDPSAMTISGGVLNISIPRPRLVTEAASDNDEIGVDYTNIAPGGPFEQTVDVKRVYTDASTQAQLVWPHSSNCAGGNCCPSCGEYTKTACMYFKDADLGIVDVLPATYSGGSWSVNGACCGKAAYARLNYVAGLSTLTRQAEDAIVRLAHAKMPAEPCGCQFVRAVWLRDNHTPEVMTRERINCDFGLSDGAWTAYRFAHAMKQGRGGVL